MLQGGMKRAPLFYALFHLTPHPSQKIPKDTCSVCDVRIHVLIGQRFFWQKAALPRESGFIYATPTRRCSSSTVVPLLENEWSLLLPHSSRNSQCFSTGRTTSKNCPFPWRHLDPHLIHIPTRVSPPNGISIVGWTVIAQRAQQTDRLTHRPTDHVRYSLCSNRPLSLANRKAGLRWRMLGY